jgi:hypothetical protein
VWCLDTDAVYLVPYADIGKRSQPHLRVDVPRPGSTGGRQSTKVRWAGRYEASGVIEGWQRTGGEFDPRWSAPTLTSTGEWHAQRWQQRLRSAEIHRSVPGAGL